MQSSDNKRIAKNTLFMYFRMLLQMGISLYTTRVVLSVLGAADFGLYNVIGGVVGMMSFFRSSMSIATQRFMSYELGLNNEKRVQEIFSCSVLGHCILCIVIVLIAETLGLWFIKNKLVIPAGQYSEAYYVYQTVIVVFIVNMIVVPYNSAIIAYERFSFFAFLSLGEVVLKLLLLVMLLHIESRKLILYSLLMMGVNILIAIIYICYCSFNFHSCRLIWINRISLYKKLFSFSGWIFAGDVSFFAATQGVNLLINVYFGPILNASRAISEQINHALTSFSSNFMLTVRPTITKKFAEKLEQEVVALVISSTKFSFFLIMLFAVPIVYNTHIILKIWLDNIPSYAVPFTQLIIINLLIHNIPTSLSYLIHASGDIRLHQIVVTVGFISILIFTWIAYYLGLNALFTLYISIGISLIDIPIRLWVVNRTIGFPYKEYVRKVLFPILRTSMVSFISLYFITKIHQCDNFIYWFIWICFNILFTLGVIIVIGLTKSERQLLRTAICKFLHKNVS